MAKRSLLIGDVVRCYTWVELLASNPKYYVTCDDEIHLGAGKYFPRRHEEHVCGKDVMVRALYRGRFAIEGDEDHYFLRHVIKENLSRSV